MNIQNQHLGIENAKKFKNKISWNVCKMLLWWIGDSKQRMEENVCCMRGRQKSNYDSSFHYCEEFLFKWRISLQWFWFQFLCGLLVCFCQFARMLSPVPFMPLIVNPWQMYGVFCLFIYLFRSTKAVQFYFYFFFMLQGLNTANISITI